MTTVVVCPGMHDPDLTADFWRAIAVAHARSQASAPLPPYWIIPDAQRWAFSAGHTLRFLHQTFTLQMPLILIGFSAGVVGMMGAAWTWQAQGGHIRAMMAIDGWGVPLWSAVPTYRLSHDRFTHWSSYGLGIGQEPFYAEPGVPHLDFWRSPDQAWGWWYRHPKPEWTNAAAVIVQLLVR